jgi:hypothetical protein
MSLWKEILALSSSSLLSRDWTLRSNIHGCGGWCAWTRSPLLIPLLHQRWVGSASGLSSIALGGTNKDPIPESPIPGRNAGELPLWYLKVISGCM